MRLSILKFSDSALNISNCVCHQTTQKLLSHPFSDSQTLLAVGSFARIFATIDSISGSKISEITLPETIEAACCPSPCKNYIFVGCFDFSMYCIKIGTGTISWKFPTGDRLKCTPCFCENSNAIVFGSYDGCVYCLSATVSSLIPFVFFC